MNREEALSGLRFLDSEIQMPLLSLPVRSVLTQVGGSQILISPGSKLSEEQLRASGEVTDLVAPSLLHTGGILRAHELFPRARLWGVPGVFESHPEIPWTHELTVDQWPYASELSVLPLQGISKYAEVEFLHRPSRTLIVTDLCFHLLRAKGLGARIILGLFGTYRRFGISRFFLRAVDDPAAFRHSVELLLDEDFDNLVMSHGDWIQGDARTRLRAAFQERGVL